MARATRRKPARAKPTVHAWDASYMAAVFNCTPQWSPPATVTLTWTKRPNGKVGIYRGIFTDADGMKARVTVRLRLIENAAGRSVEILGREINMAWSFKGKL